MDLIWWLKESKWEAKGMPLFGFMLSVRQIVIFGAFLLIGALVSIPFSGIFYKLGAFGILLFVGVLMASLKVRMVPPELQLLYVLTNKGASAKDKDKDKDKQKQGQGQGQVQSPTVLREEAPQEMFTDSDVPISFSGSLMVNEDTKVVLFVDGAESASAHVSPANRKYRLLFSPAGHEAGTHELVVKVGADENEIERVKITIRPRLGGKVIDILDGGKK